MPDRFLSTGEDYRTWTVAGERSNDQADVYST